MSKMYQVAGHCFTVSGERLCRKVEALDGFGTFLAEGDDARFSFAEGADVPEMMQVLYELSYEDIEGFFGRTEERGFLLTLKPQNEAGLHLWQIHPSCPPEFAYDDCLYDHISSFISKLLSSVPFYHLACLPDKEAAMLSFKTIFKDDADS